MTFTKEQLQNLIEFNSSDSDGQANAESWEVHKLAEMALAGMEAEPVASPFGYLRVVSGRSFQIMEGSTRPPDRSGDCAGPWFPIWTSAPAPQPLTTSERAELENYRNAQQVVPEPLAGDIDADDHPLTWSYHNGWNSCRAAMLQGAEPVTTAYKLPPHVYRELVNSLRDTAVKYQGCQQLREQISETLSAVITHNPHSGNSPAVQDGCCIMPMKLTADNGAKGALSGEFHVTHRIICQSCGGEGCEDCNEDGGWDAEIPIGWDTIKRIHEAAVEACALPAAPQQEVK
ncbi:TPA: hypothetical protein ACN78K_002218 [Enterobacter hormaechei]